MNRHSDASQGSALYFAGLFAQALLYLAAGVNHFWHTNFYVRIMPPHYAHPAFWVNVSGAAEIAGGLGLLPSATRRAAAVGLITMLLVYLDVHIYMARHAGQFQPVPAWLIDARIPLQFVLVAWAWMYARTPAKV